MVKKQTKKKEIKDSEHGKVFFSWEFSEFPRHERSSNWYLIAGVVLGGLVLFAVLNSNMLFALVLIIASLAMILIYRNNKEIEFQITEDGIVVDNQFHDYKTISNFFIIYQPPEVKVLYFEPKSILSPRMPVSLEDQDPVKIREILRQYLEEDIEQEDEPVSDQATRLFKL